MARSRCAGDIGAIRFPLQCIVLVILIGNNRGDILIPAARSEGCLHAGCHDVRVWGRPTRDRREARDDGGGHRDPRGLPDVVLRVRLRGDRQPPRHGRPGRVLHDRGGGTPRDPTGRGPHQEGEAVADPLLGPPDGPDQGTRGDAGAESRSPRLRVRPPPPGSVGTGPAPEVTVASRTHSWHPTRTSGIGLYRARTTSTR